MAKYSVFVNYAVEVIFEMNSEDSSIPVEEIPDSVLENVFDLADACIAAGEVCPDTPLFAFKIDEENEHV